MQWIRTIQEALLEKRRSLSASSPAPVVRGIGHEIAAAPDLMSDVPRYPPYDTGIPVKPVEHIIESQAELIARIYRAAGVSRAEFDQHYRPIIHNLACFLHLLPASSRANHRGAGGLYRFALELGLHSLQSASAAVFPSLGGVEQRQAMQPKWILATFIAGICSQLYRTVNNMVVIDRSGLQWKPLLQPIETWAKEGRVDVFFIRWTEEKLNDTAQASSVFLVNSIVPAPVMHYLSNDNNQIVSMMSAAITGNAAGGVDNPIARIVAPVITRVVDEDLKRTALNYGHLSIGVHMEPHLIDAMRRLIRNGVWAANITNGKNGRLWIGAEGVFIDWRIAASDICGILYRDAFAGIPQDPDTLAELLCEADVFELSPAKSRYWTIAMPDTAELREGFVKLRHREILFSSSFDYRAFETISLLLPGFNSSPGAAEKLPTPSKPSPKAKKQTDSDKKAPDTKRQNDTGNQPELALEGPATTPDGQTGDAGKPAANAHPANSDQPEMQQTPPAIPEPQKAQRKPKKADQAVPENRESESADRLLSTLKKEHAWLLREIIQNRRNGKTIGVIVPTPNGVGISHDELSAYGQNAMDFLEELANRQWLWMDAEKPTRKLHPYENNGRPVRLLVLKSEISQALGLV